MSEWGSNPILEWSSSKVLDVQATLIFKTMARVDKYACLYKYLSHAEYNWKIEPKALTTSTKHAR